MPTEQTPGGLQALCDAHRLHRDLRLVLGDGGRALSAVVPEMWLGADEGDAVHGGILATVIDVAAVFALIAATGHDWSTVDLRLDYLRPVRTAALSVTSEPLHVGRSLARVQSRLLDESGALSVVGSGTFRRGPQLDRRGAEEDR
ncbi:MAG: PaaI family thioesterase [Candidatus Dormiibacterota bacterium]